jgi:hypothetical protein
MKRLLLALIAVGVCTSVSFAYTYEVDTFGPIPDLHGTETLLMTDQGGDNMMYLFDESSARIEGTSELDQGSGGIWVLNLVGESHLDFLGGQLHILDIHNDATATLSGGLIEAIYSKQRIWDDDFDPAVRISDPHITMYYSGDLPTVQEVDGFDFLVGNWMDGTGFNIYLHDLDDYPDAIDNIQFIPEPATLALFGLGGLLLRKKK